jgi:hypothetical protein
MILLGLLYFISGYIAAAIYYNFLRTPKEHIKNSIFSELILFIFGYIGLFTVLAVLLYRKYLK